MTDRELLDKAAKAAGMEMGPHDGGWVYHRLGCGMVPYSGGEPAWNPLTDDGDALRLAVKLHLFVIVEGDQEDDTKRRTQAGHRSIGSKSQLHGVDPDAATRRAIVRAAAAMADTAAVGAA